MSFEYSADHVIGATRAGWNSYGSALYCPSCAATWHDRNRLDKPLSGPENTINVIDGIHSRQIRVEGSVNGKAEWLYLKAFVEQSDFSRDSYGNQLRCLWTAYCFHQDMTVDTKPYDNDLLELWNAIHSEKSWDSFMCEYLV